MKAPRPLAGSRNPVKGDPTGCGSRTTLVRLPALSFNGFGIYYSTNFSKKISETAVVLERKLQPHGAGPAGMTSPRWADDCRFISEGLAVRAAQRAACRLRPRDGSVSRRHPDRSRRRCRHSRGFEQQFVAAARLRLRR